MIFANGKPIDNDKTSEIYQDYIKGLENIKQYKKPLRFVPRDRVRWETDKNGRRIKARPRTHDIPYITEKDGIQFWYFDPIEHKIETNVAGVSKLKGRQIRPFRSEIVLDPKNGKDREFAYFLMNLSKSYRTGKIKLYEPEKEAAALTAKEELEVQAKFLVFSKSSPISKESNKGDEVMRRIAMQWGVVSVDYLSYDQLKLALWEKVQENEMKIAQTKRGYKEFIDTSDLNKQNEVSSQIFLALQKGVLIYDDKNFEVYMRTRGGSVARILSIKYSEWDKREDIVYTFFLNDPRMLEALKDNTDNNTPINTNTEPLQKVNEEMSYTDAQAKAEELGIPLLDEKGKKRSKKVLIKDIEKKLLS